MDALLDHAPGLLGSLGLATLQSTLVGALLLAIERGLGPGANDVRRGLVTLALVKYAIPAWLVWPILPAALARMPGAAVTGTVASTAPLESLGSMAAILVLAIWVLGSLAAMARLVALRVQLALRVAEAVPCLDPRACAALIWAAERAGLAHPPELLASTSAEAPFAAGILRPRIVLPAHWADRLSTSDLETILLHEAIHVRRRDVLRLELAAWLGVAWWWNPVFRWAMRRWRALIEDACDDHVIAAGRVDARRYCSSLLHAARVATGGRSLEPAGSAGIGIHELERRLRRIMTGERPGPRRPHAALAFVLAAALLLLPHLGPTRSVDAREELTEPREQAAPEESLDLHHPHRHGRHAHDHAAPRRGHAHVLVVPESH